MPTKICEVCGSSFHTLTHRVTTCSDRCRMRLKRAGGSRVAPSETAPSIDREPVRGPRAATAIVEEMLLDGKDVETAEVERACTLVDEWQQGAVDDEDRAVLAGLLHDLGVTGIEPPSEPANVVHRSKARASRKVLRVALAWSARAEDGS